MAKIAQLIAAGDYLVYKGDWATNTAYNVNEVVTWTDGNLYEVIKAHTSSESIKPGNTEYYKAMTVQKSLQRGSAEIAFTDIGNYDPSKTPEAVFQAVLDGQIRMLKIVEKRFINDYIKYTLSTSTVTAEEAANIYFITVETGTGLTIAYRFTLNTSGITKTLINAPTKLKVYFDFM